MQPSSGTLDHNHSWNMGDSRRHMRTTTLAEVEWSYKQDHTHTKLASTWCKTQANGVPHCERNQYTRRRQNCKRSHHFNSCDVKVPICRDLEALETHSHYTSGLCWIQVALGRIFGHSHDQYCLAINQLGASQGRRRRSLSSRLKQVQEQRDPRVQTSAHARSLAIPHTVLPRTHRTCQGTHLGGWWTRLLVLDVLQVRSSLLPARACGSQVVGRPPEQETRPASAAVSYKLWA